MLRLEKQGDARELTVALGDVGSSAAAGRERFQWSCEMCAWRDWNSRRTETANVDNSFEKFYCNWAVTNGISGLCECFSGKVTIL